MKPKLLEDMLADLTAAGKAPSTRDAYTGCVRLFLDHVDEPLDGVSAIA